MTFVNMTFVKRIMGAAALGMALLLGSGPMSPPAQAGYVMTLKEAGNDVVATGSGALDLTGLTFSFSSYDFASIDSGQGNILTGSDSNSTSTDDNTDYYTGIGKPNQPFGYGRPTVADSSSGDITGVVLGWLVVPLNYVSNTPLSGTSTYSNIFDPQCGCSSFDILGVNPGVYVWSWGTGPNQNFTVQVGVVASPGPGPTPVPEPASATLLGAALAGLLLTSTIRRIQPDA